MAIGRMLGHISFDHLKTPVISEEREEPMLIAIELHFTNHLLTQATEAATHIMKLHTGKEPNKNMKDAILKTIDPGIMTRVAAGDNKVAAFIECIYHRAQAFRKGLEVGGQRDQNISLSVLESDHQRGGFSKVALERNESNGLSSAYQVMKRLGLSFKTFVQDKNEFKGRD